MKLKYIAIDKAIAVLNETYPNLDAPSGGDSLTPADFIATGAVNTGLGTEETTKLLRKAFKVLGNDLFNDDLIVPDTKAKLQSLKRAVR